MITADFSDLGFTFCGKELSFPFHIDELHALLGNSELFTGEYNDVYIWSFLGIRAFSKVDQLVDALELTCQIDDYEGAIQSTFTGQLSMKGEADPVKYYNEHTAERVKLWDTDTSGAFVFNDTSVWYSLRDGYLYALSIQQYVKEEVPVVDVLPMDEGYEYLQAVWSDWLTGISKVVKSDNKYYNLTHGITKEQFDQVSEELEGVVLPAVLVNFYKANNVEWNAVTSAFSLHANGWDYDLLPFDRIGDAWENVNGLLGDEDVDADLLAKYSDKVKATGYANPKWIPFAEGRNGDFLLIDTDPSDKGDYGQIVELQNEAWERTVVAGSLEELIYREIGSLEQGGTEKYMFIVEHGAF